MSFLRVDLYNEGGRVYFGELTFYPSSGTAPFHPEEWDEIAGKMLTLQDDGSHRIIQGPREGRLSRPGT